MTKSSPAHIAASNRYNQKNYDTITLRIKKGEKEFLANMAKEAGKSVNQYIVEAVAIVLDRQYKQQEVISVVKSCLQEVSSQLKNLYDAGILYGSYARGDFRESSDVDLLILVKQKNKDIEQKIIDVVCKYNDLYNIRISPIILLSDEYATKNHGVYRNIKNEGVVINENIYRGDH